MIKFTSEDHIPISVTEFRLRVTMTLSEYVRLKNCIVYEVGSYERRRELLHALKGLFRGDINSPRRFEQITTIGELLEILEVRDVLSEDNVTPFKTIAERLPLPKKKKLLEAIARYENQHVPRIHVNYYGKFLVQFIRMKHAHKLQYYIL